MEPQLCYVAFVLSYMFGIMDSRALLSLLQQPKESGFEITAYFWMCTLIYVRTENDGAVQNSPPCQMHHCFCSHPNLQIMDGVSGSDCLWQVSLFKHMLTYKNSKMTTCMAIFTIFFVCVVKSGRTNHCEFSNIHQFL